jgi:beta-galactosidase
MVLQYNFSFCQKRDTEWAKADYEVATEQFKLSSSEKPIFVPEKGNINLNETADALVVKGERFEAVFSKEEGTLSAYTRASQGKSPNLVCHALP